MTDHFTLDVDPEQLRAVAGHLSRMGEHLKEKSRTVTDTPGEIGEDWTGEAATTVKAEMTALGNHMSGFWGDFDASAAALRSLAKDYDEALTEVADLNRRWDAAETAYEEACARADSDYREAITATGPDGKPKHPSGIRHEFEDIRTQARSEAYQTRRTDQHNLEYSFGMTKVWLRQQTSAAGQALVDAAPLQVTAEQVAAWKGDGSYPVRLDRAALRSLELADRLTQRQIEEEQAALREAAEEQVADDLEDLEELLEDEPADPEQLREMLERIGGNADDDYYTKALVDALGPDGLNELYDDVGRSMPTFYEVEEVWPGVELFNDAIAAGISQYDDRELNDFTEVFMEFEQGPKRWALFTDSDHADGRMNAIATTYFNRVYTPDSTQISGFDPYLSMFNLAYGDDDMLEQWEANSSGADLADVLSGATGDQREKLVQELTSVGGYPEMNQDQWRYKARLYGETLQALVARGNAAGEGDTRPSDEVELLLEYMHAPGNVLYQDDLLPYVEDALTDPAALTWIVHDIRYGEFSADTLTDAMDRIDADADELMAAMIDHQLASGIDMDRVADDIGYMLGTEDLLGQSFSPEGVVKSLAESAINAGVKNPLTGPVLGVFTAVFDELAAMEENEQKWDDGWNDEGAHRALSFLLYTKAHGEPPEFTAWVRANGREDDPGAIVDFYQEQENANTELFQELDKLRRDINDARDTGGG